MQSDSIAVPANSTVCLHYFVSTYRQNTLWYVCVSRDTYALKYTIFMDGSEYRVERQYFKSIHKQRPAKCMVYIRNVLFCIKNFY